MILGMAMAPALHELARSPPQKGGGGTNKQSPNVVPPRGCRPRGSACCGPPFVVHLPELHLP